MSDKMTCASNAEAAIRAAMLMCDADGTTDSARIKTKLEALIAQTVTAEERLRAIETKYRGDIESAFKEGWNARDSRASAVGVEGIDYDWLYSFARREMER